MPKYVTKLKDREVEHKKWNKNGHRAKRRNKDAKREEMANTRDHREHRDNRDDYKYR
jgi:hypothetical protein